MAIKINPLDIFSDCDGLTSSSAELIARIQSLGLRVDAELLSRNGGAGPAEGGAVIIGGFPVTAPVASPFAAESPFLLTVRGDEPCLYENGRFVSEVEIVPRPKFYDLKTADGIPYPRVALFHGRDCLATTVIQTCRHWPTDQRCRFCGIQLSLKNGATLARKTPDQLAEVAVMAKIRDQVSHVVLTTGDDSPPGREADLLAASASAIKMAAGLPVHVQLAPPQDLDVIDRLKESGADTIGIHREAMDEEILIRMAPAKAALGLDRYERAWRRAVNVFGPNQVSSFLLAGLGESPESLISGSDFLTDLGVFPFIVPLRPIPGSRMAGSRPPAPEIMIPVYEAVARMLHLKGLSSAASLAGCVRCGACSAQAAFERPPARLVCHPARTPEENRQALAIREEVFVKEQKLFRASDSDFNDDASIHLCARVEGQMVGTVRVFPLDEHGHWEGGRLAVKKAFRAEGAGELLVRQAMATVKKMGCRRFTAHIQERNVPFFKKIGWTSIGDLEVYFGRPHQLMQADLAKVPGPADI